MRAFTLEELSTLSTEEAVARQFDDLNFKWLRVWLAATLGFLIPVTSVGFSKGSWAAPVGVLGLVGIAWFLLAVLPIAARRPLVGLWAWRRAPAQLLAGSPRAATLALIAAVSLLILVGTARTDLAMPFQIFLAFFLIGFRLRPTERFFAHALPLLVYVGALLLGQDLMPAGEDSGGMVGGLAVNSLLALGLGLWVNRRARKKILQLFDDQRLAAGEQLRMRQELDYAREIQLSMLPADCPPQGWLDLCSHSTPATEVGGDYYDYFPLVGGSFAVVVGDVAGHGMASGLLLAGVRSCLTLLVEELDQPLAVLAKLNRMVRQTSRRRTLVTLAIVVLDPVARKAKVANAGHPPLLWARRGRVEEILLPSLPLGTELPPSFGMRELELETGDLLLLHSDGLYEGVNDQGEAYGLERLGASLARVPEGADADTTREAVLADFAAFIGTTAQRDDLTLIAIKVVS